MKRTILLLLILFCGSALAQNKNAIYISGGLPVNWNEQKEESFNQYNAFCLSGQYSREIFSDKFRLNVGYKFTDFSHRRDKGNYTQTHAVFAGQSFVFHRYHNLSIEAGINIGYANIKHPVTVRQEGIIAYEDISAPPLYPMFLYDETQYADAFYCNANLTLRTAVIDWLEVAFTIGYDKSFPFEPNEVGSTVFYDKSIFQAMNFRLGIGFLF